MQADLMEGQLSSTPSISQSYSFIATDEAESIVAAVEAAENNSDNPPGLGSGAASAPEVNFQEGYAKGNPPCCWGFASKKCFTARSRAIDSTSRPSQQSALPGSRESYGHLFQASANHVSFRRESDGRGAGYGVAQGAGRDAQSAFLGAG